MKKTEILYKDIVMREIDAGATCEEVVKRYPDVSLYYARKWSGDVFRKKDVGHFVRDRYKWPVLETCTNIEGDVVSLVGATSAVPESAWNKCFDTIRKRLYDMLEEIVKKN